MDFRESPELQSFRGEVRAWLSANVPPGFGAPGRRGPQDPEERIRLAKRWQRTLFDGGWAGLAWPREYGLGRNGIVGTTRGKWHPYGPALGTGRDRPDRGDADQVGRFGHRR